MNKIKIFLVDDHVIVRDSLKLALNSEENMFVIGEAGNSVDAIEQILYKNPDVVLMDINLPGKDGLSTAKEIKKIKNSIKILILTMLDNELYVFDAFKSNINGFVYKDSSIRELLKAIELVYSGERYFNEQIKNKILNHIAAKGKLDEENSIKELILTKRQIEIIKLAATGLTSKEIAAKLYLSELTVIKHRKNIIHKLELKNFTEVVSYAYTHQII